MAEAARNLESNPPTPGQNTRRTPQGIPWKPGQSGNPGGRPKGVAAKARELIGNNPSRLLAVFLDIAQDEAAKPGDRVAAAREYLDRAYGKSPAYAPIDGEDPLDLDALDRVRELVDDLAGRRARSPAAPAAGVPPPRPATPDAVAPDRTGGAAAAGG